MSDLGKLLTALGLIIAAIGLLLWSGIGASFFKKLGNLPGDIHYEREGFSFHFPLVTCILISIILSALGLIWGKLNK